VAISGDAVMPAKKKKKVKKKVPDRMVYEHKKVDVSYRTLGEFVPELQALMEKHGEDAVLEIFIEYDNVCAQLEWRRPENAQEKKNRRELQKRRTQSRKEEYERLKKEFGK
jgi:hypothetical protein